MTVPQELRQAVLLQGTGSGASEAVISSEGCMDEKEVKGFDFGEAIDTGVDFERLMASYERMGFQATKLHAAIDAVKHMLERRQFHEAGSATHEGIMTDEEDAGLRARFVLFLGYTSNMVSCGNRELIRFLVQHKLVDVLVTSAGGVEEDLIKCLKPTLLLPPNASGLVDDVELRRKGCNRIGNLAVPNANYCAFEDWLMPILDQMLVEQNSGGALWTPSRVIRRLGLEIANEDSIYYWAARNDIPVFCPALTDGSLGDMLFFHSYRSIPPAAPLRIDIVADVRRINLLAMRAAEAGMLILGGGVIKHHIANACLMRNGAEHAVFINTGMEWDGSDAGASPEEAKSWGKIRGSARAVKVCGEASMLFPLVVGAAFLPAARRASVSGRRRDDAFSALYT